jgi:hypothetical protein
MTERSTSRPRVMPDVSVLRIWPERVIEDSVCMRLVTLSSFTYESGYPLDSRSCIYRCAVALRRRTAGSVISHVRPKRRISRMIGSSARPLSVSSYSTRGGDSG